MKKVLILLILSFFSTTGFAGSCPDGSEPVKSISADGSYFEYKCPVFPALPIPDYVDKETESPWNFFDDFEDQSFDRYIFSEPIFPDKGPGKEPYKFKKDPDGNTYLEITVKHGWNKCCKGNFYSERAEIHPTDKRAKEKIIWYGFKVRLPKDFVHIDDRVMFSQFKNQFKGMKKSPLLGLRFMDEGKRLKIGGDTGGVAHKSSNEEEYLKYGIRINYYLKNNKWYEKKPKSFTDWSLCFTSFKPPYCYIDNKKDFKNKDKNLRSEDEIRLIMGGSFDATPLGEWTTYKVGIYNTKKDSGFVKVYKDDVLIFDYEGVTFDWKGSYKKTLVRIGPYRDSKPEVDWSKCSGDKTVDYIPLFCYGMDNKLIPKSERKKNLTDSEGYPPQSIHYDDFTVVSDKKTLDKYLN